MSQFAGGQPRPKVEPEDREIPSSLDGIRAQIFDASGLLRAFRAIQERARELASAGSGSAQPGCPGDSDHGEGVSPEHTGPRSRSSSEPRP